jgi:cyclic beta-1,2-glucan synthetase
MLGVTRRGALLHIAPCIPPRWPGFTVRYRYRSADYEISVENPRGVTRGITLLELDGVRLEHPEHGFALRDDARTHHVEVVLG